MKVLIDSPNYGDANSWWRCMGPLTYLAKHDPEISLLYGLDKTSWVEASQADVLFLHRPCTPEHMTALRIARNCNVPVWIDYDDWLYDLPMWNASKGFYNNAGTMHFMAHITACADVVTVSTTELRDQLLKINPNVVLLPNAYRTDLFPYRTPKLAPRQNVVMWRGTNTHSGDLMSVAEGFKDIPAPLLFLGDATWSLLSQLPHTSYQTKTMEDVLIYFRSIYDYKPKVMVFPLDDCLFNRCKSNIAYIEAVHAGALTVAPNLPEWSSLPGVYTYTPGNSRSFHNAVLTALSVSEETHQELLAESYKHVSLYDIRVVSQIRLGILKSITSPDFVRNKEDPLDQLRGFFAMTQLKKTPMKHMTASDALRLLDKTPQE